MKCSLLVFQSLTAKRDYISIWRRQLNAIAESFAHTTGTANVSYVIVSCYENQKPNTDKMNASTERSWSRRKKKRMGNQLHMVYDESALSANKYVGICIAPEWRVKIEIETVLRCSCSLCARACVCVCSSKDSVCPGTMKSCANSPHGLSFSTLKCTLVRFGSDPIGTLRRTLTHTLLCHPPASPFRCHHYDCRCRYIPN